MDEGFKYELIDMFIYFCLAVWVSLHRYIVSYEVTTSAFMFITQMLIFWTVFYFILKVYVWNQMRKPK